MEPVGEAVVRAELGLKEDAEEWEEQQPEPEVGVGVGRV